MDGVELVRTGLAPNFWRAPTDNDLGNDMHVRTAVWRTAGTRPRVDELIVERPAPQAARLTVQAILPLLSASAWELPVSELDFVPIDDPSRPIIVPASQRHGAEIRRHELITLNLDLEQMGVGGDTSWGAPVHSEYTLTDSEYHYRFRLQPLRPGDDAGVEGRRVVEEPAS